MDARLYKELVREGPGSRPTVHTWLGQLGVRDIDRAARDLKRIARLPVDEAAFLGLLSQAEEVLMRSPDAGMALTNLGRLLAAVPDLERLLGRLRASRRTTHALIQLFSSSQYFSDLIINDPGVIDWLRGDTSRDDRDALFDRMWTELLAARDESAERLILRRFRHRQMLRIGYNDVVRGLPLEVITQDISALAEACVEAACRLARARVAARHGEARGLDGRPLRFVVLALGKLGGGELNYSSDIDLVFLYESDGQTHGARPLSNSEFFARVGSELIRTLADHTELGQAYRVDMRLRPEGAHGPLAKSLASTIGYYETLGRTWERQALIKCRPIAGDLSLGREFIEAITPFVYRRFLGGAEIAEIRALKRQIEGRVRSRGEDQLEVKTGHGGIRDVEFAVQFLQLMHGGLDPRVRSVNTLAALERLEHAGCLTTEERQALDDTYRFLRQVEHRLQILFDRQTHRLPEDAEEQRALAIRMGYSRTSAWEDTLGPAQRFFTDYRGKTERNRRILNHLLHDAFGDEPLGEPDPLVDLVLDPDPSPALLKEALGRFPFRDSAGAYKSLMALAREEIEFLSQPRCRHFLAAIAPALVRAVAATPEPDRTLANLEKVSASLGAKAILWELFSFNPPSLRLYVELCATSQFLSEVLVNNPGMIDDLIDSLVIDRPQTAGAIRGELAELCRSAEDLYPILLSYRNREWLRIGARDILNREPIREVTRELADVAGVIAQQAARVCWRELMAKQGTPQRRGRWAILALGKLGGRELSYHGDLDLVFLYDGEGEANLEPSGGGTPASQTYALWAQRVIRILEASDRGGPLYRVDTRLRPHGSSGPLAVPLAGFRSYYQQTARAWERLALVRGRVLASAGGFGREVRRTLRELLATPVNTTELAQQTVAMRRKLGESRPAHDLKRGSGGLVEIEFLAHYLQLVQAANGERVCPNVWDALERLHEGGVLSVQDQRALTSAYDFWRRVEAQSRLVRNQADARLPETEEAAGTVARRLFPEASGVTEALASYRSIAAEHAQAVNRLFEHYLVAAAAREGAR